MVTIHILGRLGADPELKSTSGGKSVCSLRVAADTGYGDNKSTAWFTCSVWGRSGEVADAQLVKGSPIYIMGEYRQREYTDRDGNKRRAEEVSVSEWRHAGPKPDATARSSGGGWDAPKQKPSPKQSGGWGSDEDNGFDGEPIPF